jgi:MtrB/PioB family decaheme-associated outer membrane protein
MRDRLTTAIAAFLLASGGTAAAQQLQQPQPMQPPAPASWSNWAGSIDFGGRLNTVDGDEARYERYRDLRDGASTRISLAKETDQYAFSANLDNIGYRDQRYRATYDRSGKVKVSFLWDSIPTNYSYASSTPWVEESTGIFALDRAARLLVQNGTPGVVGVPSNAAQLQTPSIYRGLASPFDIQSRRDIAGLTGSFMATRDLALNFAFTSTGRSGHEPKGASFAFSVADQLPVPLDNRTNDLSAAAEWLNKQAMFRVAWDGSWFKNSINEILFDNPVRADDTSPIDPSGYSNGRGAARSRMAVPPSNSLNTVSAAGLYKMPGHSNVNGTVSFTTLNQNETLIPWTSNQVINSPAVFKDFPGLASLPRDTAEAKVHGVNALLDYTSRPNRFFGLTMRYRYNDHRNLTPVFDATEYVRMDAVPEETGGPTEQFNVRQNTFDVNAMFNVMPHTDLRVGYTLDDAKRTGREFSDSTDYTFRTTLDTVGNQYVMVRLIYEHSQRLGTGFSEQSLEDGGFQPGLRTYDVSDRNRNRGWLVVTLTPASIVEFTVSVAAARDRFKGEGHEFGLLNNDNTVFNVGMNARPSDTVQVGANYGHDSYKTLQKARNANPDCTISPPCPANGYNSWFDPNRDWLLDQDETANNANVYVDLLHAIKQADIRLSYDYSDSNNAYIYSGPRIQELQTGTALTPTDTARPCPVGVTSCFEALAPITNKWQRFMVDVRYMFAGNVGFGVGYWYEKFDVKDYATIDLEPGTPRIDYLGIIGTGYGNRPYKANTGFLRILYMF